MYSQEEQYGEGDEGEGNRESIGKQENKHEGDMQEEFVLAK